MVMRAPSAQVAIAPAISTRPTLYERITSVLSRPRAVAWIALFGSVMSLPAIATGLVGDDFALPKALRERGVFGAFAFHASDPQLRRSALLAARDAGHTPWWVDPDFHQAFLRPLSSVSHALDFALWPDAIWMMHLTNIALYALIILIAGALYRRLEFSRPALGIATLFYAVNGSHSMTVAWISGRNTLLAVMLGLTAVLCHVRGAGRDPRAPVALRWRLLGAIALCGGMFSAELGLAAAGYVLAHALVLRHGPLVQRLSALWPHAIVIALWLGVYTSGGYGALGSGFYHGPAQTPVLFVYGLLTCIPIYLASQLTWPYATLSGLLPHGPAIAAVASLGLLFALRKLLGSVLRTHASARFLLLGGLLSLLPLGASMAQDRLVFMIGFGTAGCLALIVEERLGANPRRLPQRAARFLWRIHAYWLTLLFIPMQFATASANAVGGGSEALAQALAMSSDRAVVLVNGPGYLPVTFQRLMREYRGLPAGPTVDMLYVGSGPVTFTRSSETSLELEVRRGYMSTPIERIERDPSQRPFHVGDEVVLPRMRVRVLAINADAAPTRVRFDFAQPLEHGPVWMYWQDHTPEPWQPPAIGQSRTVAAVNSL